MSQPAAQADPRIQLAELLETFALALRTSAGGNSQPTDNPPPAATPAPDLTSGVKPDIVAKPAKGATRTAAARARARRASAAYRSRQARNLATPDLRLPATRVSAPKALTGADEALTRSADGALTQGADVRSSVFTIPSHKSTQNKDLSSESDGMGMVKPRGAVSAPSALTRGADSLTKGADATPAEPAAAEPDPATRRRSLEAALILGKVGGKHFSAIVDNLDARGVTADRLLAEIAAIKRDPTAHNLTPCLLRRLELPEKYWKRRKDAPDQPSVTITRDAGPLAKLIAKRRLELAGAPERQIAATLESGVGA